MSPFENRNSHSVSKCRDHPQVDLELGEPVTVRHVLQRRIYICTTKFATHYTRDGFKGFWDADEG
ncbi:hypothetical protein [Burkholderia territorii]|uniref:hypothetical protein n=1 Tax=Burkholderia territorii TaxID=1503055 RepID=UPI000B122500|nr:hypothetical protein [Burkholderia territorii]